ncbi:MAG: hypothetical protein GTN40_02650 [Candidatus Aenigmarchaeota archaeon]|nr:hypothetical protein [Candidatus Aenigmarchaeota archaeon]
MRVWIVHPKYLDCKGLVALWRETLLARKVLKGKTKGWRNHPQLNKFKTHKNPVAAVNTYLLYVLEESEKRCYKFNKRKIEKSFTKNKIKIPKKEVVSDFEDLKNKLKKRDSKRYIEIVKVKEIEVNPIFIINKN